jgi:hypothetical protein
MAHDRTIYGSLFFVFLWNFIQQAMHRCSVRCPRNSFLMSIGRLKEGEILAYDVILLCHIKATNKPHIYLNINSVELVYSV